MLHEVFLRWLAALESEDSSDAIFDDLNVFLRENFGSTILVDANIHMKGEEVASEIGILNCQCVDYIDYQIV